MAMLNNQRVSVQPHNENLFRYGDVKLLISTCSTSGKLPISISGLLQEFNEGIEGQLSIFADFGQNIIHEACLMKLVIHWLFKDVQSIMECRPIHE